MEGGGGGATAREDAKSLKLPANLNNNSSMMEPDEQPLTAMKRKSANLEQENREILYSKLIIHENQMHPRKGGQSFSICERLGSYSCCGDVQVTDLSQEIGVGATMFLLATKSLAWLFFFLTILNLPVFAFYYASNPTSENSLSLQDYFGSLSLGNIGESEHACDRMNLAADKNIKLSCSMGLLQEMKYIGIGKDDSSTCMNILSAVKVSENFENGCYTDFGGEADGYIQQPKTGESNLSKYYKANCLNKQSCTIPIDYLRNNNHQVRRECMDSIYEKWYKSQFVSKEDKQELARRVNWSRVNQRGKLWPEPWLIAMSDCKLETVTLDFE